MPVLIIGFGMSFGANADLGRCDGFAVRLILRGFSPSAGYLDVRTKVHKLISYGWEAVCSIIVPLTLTLSVASPLAGWDSDAIIIS